MRFAMTDDQLALRAAAAEVLSDLCTMADVRSALEHPADPTRSRRAERWRALVDLGATTVLLPEAAGGLGMGDVELVGIVEEAGAACLPEPLGLHAGVGVPLLARLGAEQALADISRGALVVTGGVDVDAEGPVIAFADGMVTTPHLPDATQATWFLLATACDAGVELHLLHADQVDVNATPSLDAGRRLGAVTWTPTTSSLVATGVDAAVLVDEIASRQATYAAAELVGLAAAMLATTAAYAADRQQFGAPIGSFQAVKHLLADVRIALEFARPAVLAAAWSLHVDDENRHHDAAVAKALASDLGTRCARTCLQVHGGIGYTWEHDLSLAMKRAWSLATEHGTAAAMRARALDLALFA
jgi:alkylation response protein AidB-like acyl-CoA dehydrogenase